MIIIKLWGGLGNQLFQYAFGYQLAKKTKEKIVLDISWFQTQNMRKPEILDMKIEYDYIEKTWCTNPKIKKANGRILNLLLRIPRFHIFKMAGMNYLKEARYRYLPELDAYNEKNTYVDGYWQCARYFDNVKSDLIEMYVPKKISKDVELLSEKLRNSNSCAIHVRRGDYRVKKRIYSRLQAVGDIYYRNALNAMKDCFCEYYLFSNGIEDASNLICDVTGNKPNVVNEDRRFTTLEEWYLLRSCKNQIIGNSTFSWWAAYLNTNNSKKVFAPNRYMGNDNIIPPDWETFDVE